MDEAKKERAAIEARVRGMVDERFDAKWREVGDPMKGKLD